MNEFNNDSLPYQNKIVACIVPEDKTDLQEIIDLARSIYSLLYGVLVLIFPDKYTTIRLNNNVPLKTIKQAEYLCEIGAIESKITIVPFPKK